MLFDVPARWPRLLKWEQLAVTDSLFSVGIRSMTIEISPRSNFQICYAALKAIAMRLLFLMYLVAAFFLAGYPVGFWIIVIGGIVYWLLHCLPRRTTVI